MEIKTCVITIDQSIITPYNWSNIAAIQLKVGALILFTSKYIYELVVVSLFCFETIISIHGRYVINK